MHVQQYCAYKADIDTMKKTGCVKAKMQIESLTDSIVDDKINHIELTMQYISITE